jgi:hypothetical protein
MLDTGETLARKGMARSYKGANPKWKVEVYELSIRVARVMDEFTTNNVRDLHEDVGKHQTSNWSAMGQVMRHLAKNGVIKRTNRTIPSTRASHRGRPLRIWISLLR